MSIGALSTHLPEQTVFAAITLAFAAFGALAFFSAKRQGLKRRGWKILAHFLAVFSLLAIFLEPKYKTAPKPVGALLITPGAEAKTLKDLRDSLNFGDFAFSIDESRNWRTIFPDLKSAPDAASIVRDFPEITTLHIAGHGLKSYDLDAFDQIRIIPVLSAAPEGIYPTFSRKTLTQGEKLRVRGRVVNPKKTTSYLMLSDYGGVVDSAKISPDSLSFFGLEARPKEKGNVLYSLTWINEAGDTLQHERLGVAIEMSPSLNFLVVESSPKFETRFLKKFLLDKGHNLAVRSAISKERFRTEFFGLKEKTLDRLTAKHFGEFDLLIVDGVSLKALSRREKNALKNAVSNQGLGMLVLTDATTLSHKRGVDPSLDFFLPFTFEKIPEVDERQIKPRWLGGANGTTSPLPAPPFFLADQPGAQPIMTDKNGRSISLAKRAGFGKIGVSLISETFRWALEGETERHADFWSKLISELVRTKNEDVIRLSNQDLALVHEPVQVTLFSSQNVNPRLWLEKMDEENVVLATAQSKTGDVRWEATLWPRKTGWHVLKSGNGGELAFYVHDKSAWQTLAAAEKRAATHRFANRNKSHESLPLAKTETREVPKIWFFLIFIFSMAWLWAERKM